MTKDEQARQRLVEIAQREAGQQIGHRRPDPRGFKSVCLCQACNARRRASFRDPSKGHWCAAGLTAAMAQAGLLVPAPGTPARRGAIALLDFVAERGLEVVERRSDGSWAACKGAKPGDIIAWKQNPEPFEWYGVAGLLHAFATVTSLASLCRNADRGSPLSDDPADATWPRCSSCVWETRKGHVAGIVATDSESITTVGWNEGPSPGRVMMRRLWRDLERKCGNCHGQGWITAGVTTPMGRRLGFPQAATCAACKGNGRVRRSSTVSWRRPGGLYGVARPVAA